MTEKELFEKNLKEKKYPYKQMIKDVKDLFDYGFYVSDTNMFDEMHFQEMKKCNILVLRCLEQYLDFHNSCKDYLKSVSATMEEIASYGLLTVDGHLADEGTFRYYFLNTYMGEIREAVEDATSVEFKPEKSEFCCVEQCMRLSIICRAIDRYERQLGNDYSRIPADWKMRDIFERERWLKDPWEYQNTLGAAASGNKPTDKKYHHKVLPNAELKEVRARNKKQFGDDFIKTL